MNAAPALLAPLAVAAVVVVAARAVVRVDDHEQVVVAIDGDCRTVLRPGVNIVRPFGRELHRYDRRVQTTSAEGDGGVHVDVHWEVVDVEAAFEAADTPQNRVEEALDGAEDLSDADATVQAVQQAIGEWGSVVGSQSGTGDGRETRETRRREGDGVTGW